MSSCHVWTSVWEMWSKALPLATSSTFSKAALAPLDRTLFGLKAKRPRISCHIPANASAFQRLSVERQPCEIVTETLRHDDAFAFHPTTRRSNFFLSLSTTKTYWISKVTPYLSLYSEFQAFRNAYKRTPRKPKT